MYGNYMRNFTILYPLHMVAGEWEHWTNRVQEYIYPDDDVPEYSSILVPNVDNVRTSFLVETISKQHKVSLYSSSWQ